MGAKYNSQKPDGYMSVRNAVYKYRDAIQQTREAMHQDALRNLPEQSKENYGKKSYK